MKTVQCDGEGLEAAAAALCAGGVAVIPTDTVYGLAAHPSFPDAVERLYTIKAREAAKPIALLASDLKSVEAYAGELSQEAKGLARKHWPGALTLVVPVSGGGYEGFRVPAHDWTRLLIERCGGTLRVTSANLSGRRAATDAPAALAEVGLSADIVVDGGISPGGEASAVLKVAEGGGIEILRPGPNFPGKAEG